MQNVPQPKTRLIVNIMEHGTVVGTDDPIDLEFEDCVNAVGGLVNWLASVLAEVNESPREEIGSAILVDVLHHWTFDEQIEEGDPFEDETDNLSGEDYREGPFPAN
jgi:hypothetical protein